MSSQGLRAQLWNQSRESKHNKVVNRTRHRPLAARTASQVHCWFVDWPNLDDSDTWNRVTREYLDTLWQDDDSREQTRLLLSSLGKVPAWSLLELPRRAPPLPARKLAVMAGCGPWHRVLQARDLQRLWRALRTSDDATRLLSGVLPQKVHKPSSWAMANFTWPTWASWCSP